VGVCVGGGRINNLMHRLTHGDLPRAVLEW
jgi:hypothetical protein